MQPHDWIIDAACRGLDPAILFPEGYVRERLGLDPLSHPDEYYRYLHRQKSRAKETCNSCAVQNECLEYALSLPPSALVCGIWGGLEPNEIRNLRKKRRVNLALQKLPPRSLGNR